MQEPTAERRSPIDVIGASAAVAALGVVVVWWAVAGRHPGGVVAGAVVLVLAAGGFGAGLGLRTSRVRRGAVGGAVVALVVAVGAVGALVVQARSVGVGGDRRVELDRRVEAAWADGDEILAVTYDRLVGVDPADGETDAGPGLAIGDHVVVLTGDGGAATVDGVEVVRRDHSGSELWRAGVDVEGGEPDRVELLAVDDEGRAAVRACIDARCELVGLDADGEETWRRSSDDAVAAEGSLVVDRPSDPDLRSAPARLVLLEDPGGAGSEVIEVDLATGDETTLGAAGMPAVVGDVVTIARALPDGCQVGIIRGDDDEGVLTVPCPGDDQITRATASGSVVVHQQAGGVVAVDLDRNAAATVDAGDGVRATVAGDGVLVEQDADGITLRRIFGDEVIATYDGWGLVASGPDGVVIERPRRSDNPFAPERLREVAVIDPASGGICARVRLDVPFVSRASPLPGCRAILSPPDGPDLLVG